MLSSEQPDAREGFGDARLHAANRSFLVGPESKAQLKDCEDVQENPTLQTCLLVTRWRSMELVASTV